MYIHLSVAVRTSMSLDGIEQLQLHSRLAWARWGPSTAAGDRHFAGYSTVSRCHHLKHARPEMSDLSTGQIPQAQHAILRLYRVILRFSQQSSICKKFLNTFTLVVRKSCWYQDNFTISQRAMKTLRHLFFRASTGFGTSANPRRYASSKASDPLRVLFCGSEEFSIVSLHALHQEHLRDPESIASIDVVCRPGKPVGRGLKTVREGMLSFAYKLNTS